MEPSTFRESNAMLVDANDDWTAFRHQSHRQSGKKSFPKLVRGLLLSDRSLQMGSVALDSRPRPPPNPFEPVPSSTDLPARVTMLSPPNYHQGPSVFTPKRKSTRAFGALERVINMTRKRERVSDDVESNSSHYDSSMESVPPQPAKKMPRRGTFWPSSLLFAPPGLDERSVASPIPNPPIGSSLQTSLAAVVPPPSTPRPDDYHRKRGQFRITRLIRRPSAANPAKSRLSTLRDLFLPRPFDAHAQVANEPDLHLTMGDMTTAVPPPVQQANVPTSGARIAKPTPMPVCSNPKSLYYDGEEPRTRCESPEQIPEYYDRTPSGARPFISYPTGGNGYVRQPSTRRETFTGSIYADPFAMDVVLGPEN